MTEEKIRKRGWIKNVAIIFLAVLLVLTFFSNTIMNRSLPEVAAQYAQSGTINAKIRGTGTVSANEVYEVKIDQTRVVHSVPVSVGDTVNVGDVLLILAEGDSQELETAKEELDNQRLAYQKAVLQNTEKDYSREVREIEKTQESLNEAIARRDELVVSEQELNLARNALNSAKNMTLICQAAVDTAQSNLDSVGGGGGGGGDISGLYNSMQEALNALNEANNARATAELVHGANYKQVEQAAKDRMAAEDPPITEDSANFAAQLPIYMAAVVEEWRIAGGDQHKAEIASYDAIVSADRDVASATAAYNSARNAYNSAVSSDTSGQYNVLLGQLNAAKDDLAAAQNTENRLQSNYDTLQNQYNEWKTAADEVETLEDTLDDLVFTLEQTQESDGINAAIAELDLQAMRENIDELEARVAALEGGDVDASVTSRVSGVVSAINITAGNMTSAGTALITIDVVDRGYSTSISVTNEQSKKVAIGDTAEVTGYYWGGTVNVVLSAIRPDPNNPAQNKLLVFDVTGDVSAGSQLNLTIGQRSANYEVVVPNSAIRSDNNGNFVLIVTAKSSPLGNRYVATRVDVQVLASDDVNTAISGGVTTSDYVITTSNKPIESGMLVRMPDNV